MTDSTFKQLVFDCAMELLHGSEELSNEEIGAGLLSHIKLHDKYNSDEIKPIQSPPKIKEVVIYADEVAIVYYTNRTCEHVGEVSYSDAIMIVEGDEKNG